MSLERSLTTLDYGISGGYLVAPKPNRLFLDVHGCLLVPKSPDKSAEYIDRVLTDQEVEFLKRLVDKGDIDHLLKLTSLVSRYDPETCIGLTHPTAEGIGDFSLDKFMHEEKFFNPYSVTANLASFFSGRGIFFGINTLAKVTIATGTPKCCGAKLIEVLDKNHLLKVLDPVHSIFLNPAVEVPEDIWPTRKIYSVVSKLAALGVCTLTDQTPPLVVDDTLEIAEYASVLLGVKVMMPTSERQANQRRLMSPRPSLIETNLSKAQIEFDVPVEQAVISYLANLHRGPRLTAN